MAPTVFAAYTPPTSLAESCPRLATAARASGKLAPQRMAPGSMTQSARTMSSWILKLRLASFVAFSEGLIGQNGSDSIVE
jgi:hypothetical protein